MITVREVNRPPVWTPQADITYPAGMDLTVPLTATDPDLPRQTLRFSQTGLPPGLQLNPTNGVLSGAGSVTGVFAVTATVTDDQVPPFSATNRFDIRLTEPFRVQVMTFANQTSQIAFPAIVGERYEIQYCDSLLEPVWRPLLTIPAAAEERIEIVDPNPTDRIRHYRIDWVPRAP